MYAYALRGLWPRRSGSRTVALLVDIDRDCGRLTWRSLGDMSEDDLYAAIPSLDERSRRALTVAEKWIGDGIEGVAIGAAEDGGPAVVVYAVDPASAAVQSLPQECEGLPVRVETGDAFSAED